MILPQCLLNSDQAEYFREWAKERSNTVLSSTLLEPGDEEEPPVNFNKTICDEVDAGAMEVKREFLARFLARKQMELSEILASRRTRSFAKKEGTGNSKFVKFKDKTFQVVECEDEDQVTGEVLDENVFLTGVKQGGVTGGNKKPCPIKCGKMHVNSSLFFCNKFRKKEQEERKAIQQKLLNLCILCLGWKNAQHICPVKKCPRCGADIMFYFALKRTQTEHLLSVKEHVKKSGRKILNL